MSKSTYIFSLDTLKTMGQGALGAMSFGMYHQFTTNKIMELNNEKIELRQEIIKNDYQKQVNELKNQHEYQVNELKNQHEYQVNEYQKKLDKLTEKINKLEQRRGLFF